MIKAFRVHLGTTVNFCRSQLEECHKALEALCTRLRGLGFHTGVRGKLEVAWNHGFMVTRQDVIADVLQQPPILPH